MVVRLVAALAVIVGACVDPAYAEADCLIYGRKARFTAAPATGSPSGYIAFESLEDGSVIQTWVNDSTDFEVPCDCNARQLALAPVDADGIVWVELLSEPTDVSYACVNPGPFSIMGGPFWGCIVKHFARTPECVSGEPPGGSPSLQ